MMTGGTSPTPPPDIPGGWHLDAEPILDGSANDSPSSLDDDSVTPRPATQHPPPSDNEPPPTLEQLVEAMLFVGGHPLTPETACSAIRGLTRERFLVAVDALGRLYRRQRRPYSIQARENGFVLTVLPTYHNLRERLFGSQREARLGQSALDVLSVVAYRQPVEKAEVDAIRGIDSGAVLRQLVRFGLVAVQHRAEAESRVVRYGTTPRFLQLFNLPSLDELPRLGDTAQV